MYSRPSRHWFFTLNNPKPEDIRDERLSEKTRYIVFQLERGTSGTIHLQGYMELWTPERLSWCKKQLPRGHFEIPRKGRDKCREYCMKESTRVAGPWEKGTWIKGPGHRSDLGQAIEAISEGATLEEIVNSMPELYIRFNRGIEKYMFFQNKNRCNEFRHVETTVIIGEPGIGKTRYCYEEYPGLFKLDRSNKIWWDGYNGETTILIDDFYGWIAYGELLNILDGYPLRLEIKGGFTWAQWTRVFITSNKHPSNWYRKHNLEALKRRITIEVDLLRGAGGNTDSPGTLQTLIGEASE